MKDNIIPFPISSDRQKELAETYESTQSNSSIDPLHINKVAFVEELLQMTTVPLLNQYASHGIDIKDKRFQVDFRYAIDCMKSAIYRQLGLQHPIQDVMDYIDIED
ncbi:hypothetical protein CMI47_16190 [Candidatus Pacearchaeota archaeon]|nr:hypothetical protein [Candidatus Pacearchaeota archaeon]|tara:strand:- start:69 stop:386 length:318 start_codon:yes stop_codon:yes gene_type:complete